MARFRKGDKSLKKWADLVKGLGAQKKGRFGKGARGAKNNISTRRDITSLGLI